jgi:hypothetical protein
VCGFSLPWVAVFVGFSPPLVAPAQAPWRIGLPAGSVEGEEHPVFYQETGKSPLFDIYKEKRR